jgi:hypothetical protein
VAEVNVFEEASHVTAKKKKRRLAMVLGAAVQNTFWEADAKDGETLAQEPLLEYSLC